MKKRITLNLIALTILLVATNAWAGNPYVGGKLGLMTLDEDVIAGANTDDAFNGGLLMGYEIDRTFSVEAEITGSLSDGDIQVGANSGNWDVTTIAAYGAARFGKEGYVKAKLGMVHKKLSIDRVTSSNDGSDSSFSGGVGIGWRMFELEYTVLDSDSDFISLGVLYAF